MDHIIVLDPIARVPCSSDACAPDRDLVQRDVLSDATERGLSAAVVRGVRTIDVKSDIRLRRRPHIMRIMTTAPPADITVRAPVE